MSDYYQFLIQLNLQGSAYQPTLPKSMVFHLVGAFRYTLQRIKIENTKTLLPTLKEKTDEFCALVGILTSIFFCEIIIFPINF